MKGENRISVIIPAYNASAYIAQCLDVVVCQSYMTLEIIVIDDGSTDNTIEIVRGFPVKLITQENKGVSAARNAGIRAASGDYIHFLDADDIINLEFYEKMILAAVRSGAEIACCGLVHERLPAITYSYQESILVSATEDKMRLTNVGNQGYSVKYLFKKSLLDKHQLFFDEDMQVAEDMVFSFKAVYWANKIITVPGATYYYKHRINSAMTTKGGLKRIDRRMKIQEAKRRRDLFAQENNISVIGVPTKQDISYKLFGFIPFFKKRIFDTGRIRWYLFGFCVMQRK